VVLPGPAAADQIRFDRPSEWRQWSLPLGAVRLDGDVVRTVELRRGTNAVSNLTDFGGGIRAAGSNPATARLTIDGSQATGWEPDWDRPAEDWFIEIDLGRAVNANGVSLIFDDEGPAFELFDLLLSTGEPETDFIAAPIPGTVIYRISERFKGNRQHTVTLPLEEPDSQPIQFIRVDFLLPTRGARLMEVVVDDFGDNIAFGLLDRGGGLDVAVGINSKNSESAPLGNARALVDGDLYQRWRHGTASRASEDIDAHMILDLGATYNIDLVRVIGGVVVRSGFGGGITTTHYVQRRRWGFRYYELMTSDGSLSPDGTRIWTKHHTGLARPENTARGLVDHEFDPIPTRFMRIFWKFWDTSCTQFIRLGEDVAEATVEIAGCAAGGTVDEIMIYGTGHPIEVQFNSPLINLGGTKNLNTVEWQGEVPPGTRIEIRSRTGNEVVPQFVFHDKNGKVVTEKRYGKLIPSFRGEIDTLITPGGDWSPWSKVYAESGEFFQSPSPRQFMELDVRLTSDDPAYGASIDWLGVNFTPPLAEQTLGEIYPLQADPGVESEFSYFLRALRTRGNGFDRLLLQSSAPVAFSGILVDDEPVEGVAVVTEAGFLVTLPDKVRSGQLVELRFDATVFLQGTRFDLFLQDTDLPDETRQLVDAGDATDLVESSTNVVMLPVTQSLLNNLVMNTRVLTPNGDGVNDNLVAVFDLVNVLVPRPLTFSVFDLSGRRVHNVDLKATAGRTEFSWDGRADDGDLVPPGLYILDITISGDTGDRTNRRVVSVAY
jgi:hypothetical protein